ncbi:MAG: hypothetical protein RIE73_11095 [Coleofasciculus sp. C1-SOL-03]|uniref:hypothetical protein n=1 Tax=Coleofasciculus sp. C1-SOL-03 TaxID=3069522 RepID=UPI0032FCBFDE
MFEHKDLPEAALYQRNFNGTLFPLNTRDNSLPILARAKFAGKSCYVPQSEEPNKHNVFYSVSNVLKLTQDAKSIEALRKWEARIGTNEAKRIRYEAIGAGKALHAYLHSYLTGKEAKPVNQCYEPYFQALNQLLPHFGTSLLSEQFVVSFKYQYFGKLDQLSLYREALTLSDLKTSLKPKLSLDWIQDKILQLAAYYIPVETLYPVEQAALLYLISDGSSNEFIFTPEQMICYKQLWLERLTQVNDTVASAA